MKKSHGIVRRARSSALVTALAAAAAASHVHGQSPLALEVHELVLSGAWAEDNFGIAVALDGDRALVGRRPNPASPLTTKALAALFERQADGSWTQTALLVPASGGIPELFGSSLALDGDRALLGAHVFERQGDGTWLQVTSLAPADGPASGFGVSVSLQGDRALIGAHLANAHAVPSAGAAYVFERQPSGTWLQIDKLIANDAASNDGFGCGVSLSGDRALIGAYRDETVGVILNPGSAYVFERQPAGSWNQVAHVEAGDPSLNAQFGSSVALEDGRALVGAEHNASAYVFDRQGDGTWLQAAKLKAAGASVASDFGWSVSLDGDRALVGAPGQHLPSAEHAGASHLFERQSDGAWLVTTTITASNPGEWDNFGSSVALEGHRALIGARHNDPSPSAGTGAAYVFRLCDGCLVPFGTGSPGCLGFHLLAADHAPEVGTPGFAITCTKAPPSAVGLLGLGDAADAAGGDPLGLGVLLHIDVLATSFLSILPMASDPSGFASKALPIPPDPALSGTTVVAQALWLWSGCPFLPGGLSSSKGLEITLLAP